MDFVFFGLQSWDIEIGSNSKNLAKELSKNHRVLYINRALDRKTKLFSKTKQANHRKAVVESSEVFIEKVSHNLWTFTPGKILESINWITFDNLHDWLNKINSRRFANEINKALRELAFENVVLVNDNDFIRGQQMKKLVKPSLYVYYLRDMLSLEPYFNKHGSRLEIELIKSCDLVIANSESLSRYASKFLDYSYSIGQGCDLTSFDVDKNYEMPTDIKGIKTPIIGYVGVLSSARLDIDLIYEVARHSSNLSIVLVGPEDLKFESSKLHGLDNVYFLGPKKPDQLAQYIDSFNICINPQSINTLTQGNYPRKIDEYLAMGKPVVATKTEAMEMFSDHVILCEGWLEYVESINRILEEGSTNKLEKIAFAKSHSWINNTSDFYQLIISKQKQVN